MQLSVVFRFLLKFISIPFLRGIGGRNKLPRVWVVEVFWLSALGAQRSRGARWCHVLHQPCPSLCGQVCHCAPAQFKCWRSWCKISNFLFNLRGGAFCFAWNRVDFVVCMLISGLGLGEKSWSTWRIELGSGVVEWVKPVCWLLLLGDQLRDDISTLTLRFCQKISNSLDHYPFRHGVEFCSLRQTKLCWPRNRKSELICPRKYLGCM